MNKTNLSLLTIVLFTGSIVGMGTTSSYQEKISNKKDYEISQVELGFNSSAVIVKDFKGDHLYTWGVNKWGQLGLGDSIDELNTPQEIYVGKTNIKQIDLGLEFGAMVTTGSDNIDYLHTWGDNRSGQLGIGDDFQQQYVPKIVEISGDGILQNDGEIKQLALGNTYSAVITNNFEGDHLYMWGDNKYGQLGLGDSFTAEKYYYSQEIPNEKNTILKEVSLGKNHSGLITTDETGDHLYMWGDNTYGQLGLGNSFTHLSYNTPQEITDINQNSILDFEEGIQIENINLGYNNSSVITKDSNGEHLYVWGSNESGQLGLGQEMEFISVPQEVDINQDGVFGNEGNIKEVSVGNGFSAAITTDSKNNDHLYMWGKNQSGQLGLGETNGNVFSPQEVSLNENKLKEISLGETHSALITTDSKHFDHLYTWGSNENGQLGLGQTGISYSTPQEVSLPINIKFNWTIVYVLAPILLIIIIILISILIAYLIKRVMMKKALTYIKNKQ